MDPRYNYYHDQIPNYSRTQGIDEPQSNTQAEFDMIAIMAGYQHRLQFPFGDNMLTLIFIIFSQLDPQQRLLLTSHMQLKNITIDQYVFQDIRSWFIELLCNSRSSLEDPSVRQHQRKFGRARSFIVMDEGECEGSSGMWVEDYDTGIEGFLETTEDCFWIFDDENFTWAARRFSGRRFVKRGRGKGKGKGRKGKGKFRSRRRKGKGKGRSYATEESWSEYWPEDISQNWEQSNWTDPGWQQYDPNSYSQWDGSVSTEESHAAAFKGKGKGKSKGKFKGKPFSPSFSPPGKGFGKFKGFSKGGGKFKGKGKDGQADQASQSYESSNDWPQQELTQTNTAINSSPGQGGWYWADHGTWQE
jgi:hypothetical protein